MGQRSKTHSRCQCGHKTILVNGHWQHTEPHPDHACSCKEPAPGIIGQFRTSQPHIPNVGISTIGRSTMRLAEQERTTHPWQLIGGEQ